jgi:hypothetical protein
MRLLMRNHVTDTGYTGARARHDVAGRHQPRGAGFKQWHQRLLPAMTSVTHGATKELRPQSDFGRRPEIPGKLIFGLGTKKWWFTTRLSSSEKLCHEESVLHPNQG